MAIPGAVMAQNSADDPSAGSVFEAVAEHPNAGSERPGCHRSGSGGSGMRTKMRPIEGRQPTGIHDGSSADQPSMSQGPMDPAPTVQTRTTKRQHSSASIRLTTRRLRRRTNGVARISLIHGDVSTQRGDSKDWSAAVLNAPVLAGDRVSTGDKARTELETRLRQHASARRAYASQHYAAHALANPDSTWTRHGELHRVQGQRCRCRNRYAQRSHSHRAARIEFPHSSHGRRSHRSAGAQRRS